MPVGRPLLSLQLTSEEKETLERRSEGHVSIDGGTVIRRLWHAPRYHSAAPKTLVRSSFRRLSETWRAWHLLVNAKVQSPDIK